MEKLFEQLPPETLAEHLASRKHQLQQLLATKIASLKAAPRGRLRTTGNKGTVQFYHVLENQHPNGTYIPKKAAALARELAQKDYDQKLIAKIQAQLQIISSLQEQLRSSDLSTIYRNLTQIRQSLVEPAILSPEEYTRRWQSLEYQRKGFSETAPVLLTAKNERVRSKSEVIIADTLCRLGIPYRYEFPLTLKNFEVHPDFCCLNVKRRSQFYWEHFGMMDDPEYAARATEKLAAYQAAGIFPGKNLIITMETAGHPLSSRQIELLAKEFLLS